MCITFILPYYLAINYYPANDAFLGKEKLKFVLQTLRNVRNVKVPFFFSCAHFTVFSCAIHAAQLVQCTLCFNLKTLIFLGGFSSLRNYKLKSVADITLRTLHIMHVRFFSIQTVGENLFLTIVILN